MSSNITGTLHLTGGNLISSKCWKCVHNGVCSHKEEMVALVNKVNEMEVISKEESIFKLDINCQYFMEFQKPSWYTHYDGLSVTPCTVTKGTGTGLGDYIPLSGHSVCGGVIHGNITDVHTTPANVGTSTTDIKQSEPIAKPRWTGNDNIQFYQ